MDQTLKQLGELLLGSIPTVIFLLATFALYTIILHKPLVKVLAERRAKTEGAIEKAKAQKQVEAARAGIEKEKAEAQIGLTAEAGKLATEMIRTVLSPAGGR